MRVKPMVVAVALGLIGLGCSRRDQAEVAADSARVADSVSAVQADSAAKAAAGATTSGASRSLGRENLVTVTEEVPGLLTQAKFIPIDAQHLAQTKFPTGEVKSGRIERRAGDLVYIFTIQQQNVKGVELVLVDAMTGALLNTIHQDADVAQNPPRKTP